MAARALGRLYRDSLALATDLYQLTMACAYWKSGLAEHEAAFHLVFRKLPFGGGFCVACGLATACELLESLRFSADDLAYLAGLHAPDGTRLFEPDFLRYLERLEFAVDVDGLPEGTPVFPQEPLLRVQGPLAACQILETPLLTIVNFQTLVATKAARAWLAAEGQPILEFGLRRAQGLDGGVSASRAAYVGGCAATSNVLAGKLFDIPVRGTHAHSWVMCFDQEQDAFQTYAAAMPHNCVLLVDTYDTLQGVRRAAEVGKQLQAQGHALAAIRLDSGDLAALSSEARRILDGAGLQATRILASGDLDEYLIAELKRRGAPIDAWGVGTRLATAYDQPALGGVYKLAALRAPGGTWQQRVKISDDPIKSTIPGVQQVRRYRREGTPVCDLLYNTLDYQAASAGAQSAAPSAPPMPSGPRTMVELRSPQQRLAVPDADAEDLLVPVFRQGKAVYDPPSAAAARSRTLQELARLPAGIKRLADPDPYPVFLDRELYELRERLRRAHQAEQGV
jgi:nicotinate phosphoribosyltransferase